MESVLCNDVVPFMEGPLTEVPCTVLLTCLLVNNYNGCEIIIVKRLYLDNCRLTITKIIHYTSTCTCTYG